MSDVATDPADLKVELTYLDRRVFCELRDGTTLFLGILPKEQRTPAEFIQLTQPHSQKVVSASLIRVTPKLIYYRQVMSDGKANFEGNDRINDQQK